MSVAHGAVDVGVSKQFLHVTMSTPSHVSREAKVCRNMCYITFPVPILARQSNMCNGCEIQQLPPKCVYQGGVNHHMADLDQLKQKYQSALTAIQQKGIRLAHMHVQDGKLFLQGDAPSEQAKNDVWNAVKAVDPGYSDLTLDLTVNPALASAQQSGSAAGGGLQTYTVQSGDTLSKIAQRVYGDSGQYMRIFEANRDTLKDPNQIRAGQQLNIPA
jgi:LysM repeat protein